MKIKLFSYFRWRDYKGIVDNRIHFYTNKDIARMLQKIFFLWININILSEVDWCIIFCWLKPLLLDLTISPWCISSKTIHLEAVEVVITFIFLVNRALSIKSCQNLIFCFFVDAYLDHVWKFYQLFFSSTFSMTNCDTLVQISTLNFY